MTYFHLGHPKQPIIPIIRVRVEYREEEHIFNVIRFGQKFQSKVANISDMIILKKEKKIGHRRTKDDNTEERENFEESLNGEVKKYC